MSNLLTITEACQEFKLNRATIYRYIKTGVISTSKNEKNKTVIDRSEILRVFPETYKNISNIQSETLEFNKNNEILLEKIKSLEEKLRDKDDLILSLNGHINTLKQSLILIESINNQKVENVSECITDTKKETKSKKSWKFWKK